MPVSTAAAGLVTLSHRLTLSTLTPPHTVNFNAHMSLQNTTRHFLTCNETALHQGECDGLPIEALFEKHLGTGRF